MVRKVLAAYPEVKFRVDLTKNQLQLQGRPTLEGVLQFYTHLLAELQVVAPVSLTPATTTLKAIGSSAGTGEALTPTGSPTRKTGSKPPCKFFLTTSGCTRGQNCKYDHSFPSKEEKKARCWECGSQQHRKGECPTKQARASGTTSRSNPESPAHAQNGAGPSSSRRQQPALEVLQTSVAPSEMQLASTSSSSAPAPSILSPAPIQAELPSRPSDSDVQSLLREANAMLSKLAKLQTLEVKTNHSIGELSAAIRAAGLQEEEGFALLDTGASHAFKTADNEVIAQASPVRVELAGGQYVTLKQNKAGTLLAAADDPTAMNATPILPLGALVQTLGCELTWTRKGGLKVVHPEFGVLRTFVKGNHPMLAETQALEIISQLEDHHLRTLEDSTTATFVRSLDYEEVKSWDFMLGKFVAAGELGCLLEALESSCSPLGPLPQHVLSLAAVHVGLDDKQGWKYLKALPLRRSTRKAMMTRRWIVRLYRRDGEADLQISNSEGAVMVDCNLARSKRFSLKGESAMYKALMWAAARGQIEGILGSPPVNDGAELLAKQLLLWAVAKQGAVMHGFLPPYMLLGSTPSSSMWKSDMWSSFRQEYHVPMMQVETSENGDNYLIATNLAMKGSLLALDSVEAPEGLAAKAWPNVWKLPFQKEVGLAVDRWRMRPDEMFLGYMLHKLDSDSPWSERDLRYWRRHVSNGHLPFDRRCRTCIQTAATGRAHRRVIAPSCYTLSLDVCGPFRVKGEYGGSKGFRYALIGTYLMPKLDGYKDAPVPEEPDIASVLGDQDEGFLEEQGPPEPPLDPEDQEDLDKSNKRFQDLYKQVGDAMEYQTLHFAIPMKTRLTPEVEDAVKSVYLQIRAEGLPVARVHSDRARELRGSKLRSWLLHRDVLPTTGEAQAPQTNGRAEAGVKRAKVRTKTLLRAAGLDTCCWPFAMSFAAFQQRECALGRGQALIPFGSPVLVRSKVYGTGGHFDLDERWQGGVYVGPSHELRQGHVVRFPSGRVVTSLHLRANAEDPDRAVPLAPVEASFPVPSRRITGRRPLVAHEVRRDEDLVEPSEVPSNHGDPLGHDIGHSEAAGVWTDDEGPVVRLLGDRAPQLMAYRFFSPSEPSEVHSNHGDPLGRLWHHESVAVKALKPLSEPERRAEELAQSYLDANIMGSTLVLQLFEALEEVQQLFTRAARRKPRGRATSWATGAFTHGGVSGLRDGAKRLPNVTRFLAKFAREFMGAEQFATVVIQRNGGGKVHRDSHNYPGSRNWLCPLTSFEGGGLWTQLEDLEEKEGVFEVVEKEVKPNVYVRGLVRETKKGEAFSFNPMMWHEVQSHVGDRVMVIAFTPRLNNLNRAEADYLKDLGFLVFGEEETQPFHVQAGPDLQEDVAKTEPDSGCGPPLLILNEAHHQLLEDLQQRGQSLRLLLEEERMLAEDLRQAGKLVEREAENMEVGITQMLDQAARRLSQQDRARLQVCLKAASEANEPDYEDLLKSLEGELQVVHTVPLSQVKPVVDRWHAAIRKELDNLFNGGTLVEISREEARRLERQGALRLVPSKGVHTLKPPANKSEKYKRKYRLVLCGNFAAPEEQFGPLYAGGASAETFRTVLAVAAGKGWLGATADITGAFLLAPWPEHLHRYAVVPPKLLIDNGYVSENAFWLVMRPLYGLRESPAIWSSYRSTRFSQARILYKSKYLVLRVSKVDPELWFVFFENEEGLVGCVITYVDDLFYVSEKDIVMAVHAWIVEEWPCSALEWASDAGGTRYLGMEVFQRPSGAYEVHQKGYILDLLRSHDMIDTPGTKLPCPKEWITDDLSEDSEEFTESDLRFGQRMVGEQLWLTMRCRPDLQFVVGHMAQWVSRQPCRVARIAKRVLSYLASSLDFKLILGESSINIGSDSISSSSRSVRDTVVPEVMLVGYSDSSFAPYGGRSYGASVVTVNNSPVAWKSGKQAMITLSTMESELLEATNAVVLLESVGSLLDEILGKRVKRVLKVDNSSATSMLQGGAGSWRTRHLKVRSGYLREQVSQGLLEVFHTEGRYQLADLGTKMHPRARLLDLLQQWNFEGLPPEAVCARLARMVVLHCFMVALRSVPLAEASEQRKEVAKDPLPTSGVDELLLVAGVVAVLAVLFWELVKWAMRCMRRSVKRESKLKRLRELARLAAEVEIDRIEAEQRLPSSEEVRGAVQSALGGAGEGSGRPTAATEEADEAPEPPLTSSPRPSMNRPTTPRASSELHPRGSPGSQSVDSYVSDDLTRHLDRDRLCQDVLSLMHCDALRAGLRQEQLTVSGLKNELVKRLALRLVPDPNFGVPGRVLPTERQLRFVLWLWRHKHLQTKCALQWNNVSSREGISNWLRLWKDA